MVAQQAEAYRSLSDSRITWPRVPTVHPIADAEPAVEEPLEAYGFAGRAEHAALKLTRRQQMLQRRGSFAARLSGGNPPPSGDFIHRTGYLSGLQHLHPSSTASRSGSQISHALVAMLRRGNMPRKRPILPCLATRTP